MITALAACHSKKQDKEIVPVLAATDTVKVTIMQKGPDHQVLYEEGYFLRPVYKDTKGAVMGGINGQAGTLTDSAFKPLKYSPIAVNPR